MNEQTTEQTEKTCNQTDKDLDGLIPLPLQLQFSVQALNIVVIDAAVIVLAGVDAALLSLVVLLLLFLLLLLRCHVLDLDRISSVAVAAAATISRHVVTAVVEKQ